MIFVDTWAWIALADQSDPYHRRARAQDTLLRRARHRYVTSDDVLGELITYLYDASPAAQARAFIESIFEAAEKGVHQIVYVSPDQFRRAWELRQKYHDKPDISFVDFTSMVIMLELRITEVFTGDAHFQQVGLGFHLLP